MGGLTPGLPVVSSPDIPDGRTETRDTSHGPVTALGVREHEAATTRLVRAGLADVLAWLTNPPDMRTGTEILRDLQEPTIGCDLLPWVKITEAQVVVRVRDVGPCVWCSTPTVRWRQAGKTPTGPLACNPSHARGPRVRRDAEERAAAQAAAKVVRQATKAAAEEADRKARCPRPDKIPYPTRVAAHVAWEDTIAKGYRGTLSIYKCHCGAHHLGNAAKTLNARINVVKQVRKARNRDRKG